MLRLPSLGELDHTLSVRAYLCTSTTDMRKGFDTLAAPAAKPDATSIELKASELAMLLEGIDLRSLKRRKRFQQTS